MSLKVIIPIIFRLIGCSPPPLIWSTVIIRKTEDQILKYYQGRELDPRWVSRVKRLSGKGWEKFTEKHGDQARTIRKEISQISGETGLPISEFRRIVTTVKTGERAFYPQQWLHRRTQEHRPR